MPIWITSRSPAMNLALISPLKFSPQVINFAPRPNFSLSATTRSRPTAYDKTNFARNDSKANKS